MKFYADNKQDTSLVQKRHSFTKQNKLHTLLLLCHLKIHFDLKRKKVELRRQTKNNRQTKNGQKSCLRVCELALRPSSFWGIVKNLPKATTTITTTVTQIMQ